MTKLSCLTARPSLVIRTLHVFVFVLFCPTDRVTFARERAMGNETFYWDGLNNFFALKFANFSLQNTIGLDGKI